MATLMYSLLLLGSVFPGALPSDDTRCGHCDNDTFTALACDKCGGICRDADHETLDFGLCCISGGGNSSSSSSACALEHPCDADPGTSSFLILSSQHQVDRFGRNGCTAVRGGVWLTGNIRDLSPLRNLTSIGSSLVIYQAEELETLSGFSGTVLASIPGSIRVEQCPVLRSLAGLESITSAGSLTLMGLPQLLSLHGLRGLRGSLGGIWISDCPALQSLDGLEGVTSVGSVRSCPQPCKTYRGRRATCDMLQGRCRCPLGHAGPDCLESPVLDVALPPEEERRTLRIRRPKPMGVSTIRREDLCLPLVRSSSPTTASTAVRFRELANKTCPSRDAGYSLLAPFNNVSWSSDSPTQGCLMVHLNVWSSWSCSSPLRLVLAYESPSRGRDPDHLINRTLGNVCDVWDHPWPECLHIGTCSEQQQEMALVVHFVEQEDCPNNMELDNTEWRCVATPGHWALADGNSAVPCPLYLDGRSTCLGRNRCAEGHKGVMCATCPAGHVQQNDGCDPCGSGQGILCVIAAVVFVATAAILPHLLSCQGLNLGRDTAPRVQWPRLWTTLKITYLKLQELMVWSWGFLVLFPQVRQRLSGHLVPEVLAEIFSSLAFPPFLQCGCGVDIFGEFGILMLAPTAFVAVASASACWGAWRGTPVLAAARQRLGLLSRCCHGASTYRKLWVECSGLQLLFCAQYFTFAPLAALVIVYAPLPGVGFHCLGTEEEQECFFRRDYRLRLDSTEYAAFFGWWQLCCAWQLCTLLVLLLCLTQAGVMTFFCSEFKPKRAPFEIINLLRLTLLSGVVLLSPSWERLLVLPQLNWCCLISCTHLFLLHLIEPYRNRGDQLLQSFHTVGGVVVFTTLIVELEDDAVEGWVRPVLPATVSLVLLGVVVAPFCKPLLHPTLRAWLLDKVGAAARGNEAKLHPHCEYDCLLLEEKNTGRDARMDSLFELLSQVLAENVQQSSEDVTYARRFRFEEFVTPGDPDNQNPRWVRVFPGSEVLTRSTVGVLLRALSNILTEVVGWRGRMRRPQVIVSNKRPELLQPFRGIAYYNFILLRERRPRPTPGGPSTKELLERGIEHLRRGLGEQEAEGAIGEQWSKDSKIMGRLEAYELQEVRVQELQLAGYLQQSLRERHVVVQVRLDRSMDHQEAMELPGLLERPFKLACNLRLIPLEPDWCLRIVTRGNRRPFPCPLTPSTQEPPSTQSQVSACGQATAWDAVFDI